MPTFADFDLNDKTIKDHVANGMRLTHLAIVYDNILSCVLDEDGVIRKVRFLGADDDTDSTGAPNLVTAVLLDFRAWDTLGEATVLFCAALGAAAILRRNARIKTNSKEDEPS